MTFRDFFLNKNIYIFVILIFFRLLFSVHVTKHRVTVFFFFLIIILYELFFL